MENPFLGILIGILFVLMLPIAWFYFSKQQAIKDSIVSAAISIYENGKYHVELICKDDIRQIDLVQLAVSYFSNICYVTLNDHPDIKQSIIILSGIVARYSDNFDGDGFRYELTNAAETPQQSLLSTGKLASQIGEQYVVRLIRTGDHVFSLSDFSISGYKPNTAFSSLALICHVSSKLDDEHLWILNRCILIVHSYVPNRLINMSNNQVIAQAAVKHAEGIVAAVNLDN